MQPYRSGVKKVQSQHLPGVIVSWREHHAAIEWEGEAPIYSNAVFRGGSSSGNRIVNYMVDRYFDSHDPVQHMKEQCLHWGYKPDATVGLITAAKVTHMSIQEMNGDQFSLLCCTSAGTANAARAGLSRETYSAYLTATNHMADKELTDRVEAELHSLSKKHKPGTINIILVLDANIGEAAIFNAMLTVAEAKAAALADLGIVDPETGRIATGTTTDAVAIAIMDSGRYTGKHLYAGTATTIGNAIGKLVYETVTEAVATQKEQDQELFPIGDRNERTNKYVNQVDSQDLRGDQVGTVERLSSLDQAALTVEE